MRFILALAGVLLAGPTLLAQEAPAGPPRATETVWTVSFRGKEIGTETTREGLVDGRRILSSRGDLQLPGAPRFEYEQQVEVGADGAFARYELKSKMIGASAELTDEGAKVSRTYMGNTGETKVAKGAGPFVVLDNLVWSHYTFLARRAAKATEPFAVVALVPQGQVGIEGRFDPGEALEVVFREAKRKARRGTLTIGGQLVALTYDLASGEAYRVEVPAQQFDAWVKGFARPEVKDDAVGPWKEVEVEIPAPQGPLPGTLTIPLEGEAWPVAVLVHGSGPNDRDETLGPNKPFRDIAHGLAERGVATIRYDKRTFLLKEAFLSGDPEAKKKAGKALETMGFDKEVIEDAVAVLAWAKADARFTKRVVIGHSLGGMAAPYIAPRHEGLAGLVLMAAPARGLDVITREQLIYKATLVGKSVEEATQEVDAQVGDQWAKARKGELPDSARIMGATVFYWKSLFAHEDVPGALAKVTQPVLLLQGAKDYQVTTVDYELLEKALESREGGEHEAVLYPTLNHLFMPVEGKSTGAEYMVKGRMASEVIDSVAAFVARISKGE
jgi:dienelactone hydrolase